MSPAGVVGGLSDEERRGGGEGERGERRWVKWWWRIDEVDKVDEADEVDGGKSWGGQSPRREEDKNEALALPMLPCAPRPAPTAR